MEQNFGQSAQLVDQFLETLQSSVEAELEAAIRKAVTGKLRRRSIKLNDAMGVCDISISTRHKHEKEWVVLDDDVYGVRTKSMYYLHMRNLPVIVELQAILAELEDYREYVSPSDIIIEV